MSETETGASPSALVQRDRERVWISAELQSRQIESAGYEVPGSIEEQISGSVDRRLLTLEQQLGLGGTDLPDIEAAAAGILVSDYIQKPLAIRQEPWCHVSKVPPGSVDACDRLGFPASIA